MKLLSFLRKVKSYLYHYKPSVEVLISKTRLIGNLRTFQNKYPRVSFAPVLKSNAYGHGLVQIAQILDNQNIPFIILDSLHEAIILRNNGVRSNILIIGYTQLENIKKSKTSNVSFTVGSLEQLKEIAEVLSSKIKIHLKVDTGMHRQGILQNQINKSIEIIKTNKFLILEGVCSHFADADNKDKTFTKIQIEEWKKVVNLFKKNFRTIKFFHISSTAGAYYSNKAYGNVARLGIGLYGINLSPFEKLNLKPVLQMQTIISSIKQLNQGKYVGYSLTYKTKSPTDIATIPAGYYEGIDRKLSNCGFLKINNAFCPIIGNISMNITTLDITTIPKTKINDKVIIISNNKDDKNSVENIAKISHTIPYEIFVHIPQHLRRKII